MSDKQIDEALEALKRIDDTHVDDIPPHVEVGECCWKEVRTIRAALERQRVPDLPESLQNVDTVMERGGRVLERWRWKLAPMGPTPEMLFESSLPNDLAAAEYKAMLAAAPEPE